MFLETRGINFDFEKIHMCTCTCTYLYIHIILERKITKLARKIFINNNKKKATNFFQKN